MALWKGLEHQPFQSHAIEHIPCTPIVVGSGLVSERAHKEGFCRNVVRFFDRIKMPSQILDNQMRIISGQIEMIV